MDKITFEYWKSLILESKTGIFIVLTISVILAWVIYSATQKTIEIKEMSGTLIGIHQVPTKTTPGYSIFVVKLRNGKNVQVTPSNNIPFKKGKEVKIKKITKENGAVYYTFKEYNNTSANNTP